MERGRGMKLSDMLFANAMMGEGGGGGGGIDTISVTVIHDFSALDENYQRFSLDFATASISWVAPWITVSPNNQSAFADNYACKWATDISDTLEVPYITDSFPMLSGISAQVNDGEGGSGYAIASSYDVTGNISLIADGDWAGYYSINGEGTITVHYMWAD